MDIIEAHGGSVNYDEMTDAEPIFIDGIPYMVMGHAQYYVDSRVMSCALAGDDSIYKKFVVTGNSSTPAINYQAIVDDIVENSGLGKLLARHLDSLSSLWRLIDEYDDIASRRPTSSRVPDRPPTRPRGLTPSDLKQWAESVALSLSTRGVKVPNFRYPRKCNWISETTQPNQHVDSKSLMAADMICCRYVECLESSYVYTAQYISDLQDAIAKAMKSR